MPRLLPSLGFAKAIGLCWLHRLGELHRLGQFLAGELEIPQASAQQ